MTFSSYLKEILAIALANGLALAVPLAVIMAVVGDTSADLTANIGFERFDGLWLLPVLPLTLALLLLLISPLAFICYRLLRRLPGLRYV